jgi:hypothetical protein
LATCPTFVEPFAGSLAVLLERPDAHAWWDRTETVNDADGFISNAWRAIQAAPDEVAHWADWPVNENDLHARHMWLVGRKDSLASRLEADPDYYDAKIAGWWLWGINCWIGSGFCSGVGPWHVVDGELRNDALEGEGAWRKRPHLGNAGQGIHRNRPHLGNGSGKGQGTHQRAWAGHLKEIMQALSDRLRRVRVCSGDWSRVCGPSPTVKLGLTGVFLDPPYSHETGREDGLYRVEMAVADEVRGWALEQGDDPLMRIALCGYDGEHEMPETWECVAWKAGGGYASQGDGSNLNAHRERIWFSPHTLKVDRPRQIGLFDHLCTLELEEEPEEDEEDLDA